MFNIASLTQESTMPDPIMFQEDAYVVLETNQPEVFLTADELLEKLKVILAARQEDFTQRITTSDFRGGAS